MNQNIQEEAAIRVLSEAIRIGIRKSIFYASNLIAVGYVVAQLGAYVLFNTTDDTDGEKRSNMMLHTDHKTGCQYLSSINGGLHPRLDNDGQHMGCIDHDG